MRKSFLITLLTIAIAATVAIAKEPKNLETCKKDLIAYHDSGNYMHDINNTIKHALSYLQLRLSQPADQNKKLAIILDIDETSLSNYQDLLKLDFGGTPDEQRQAEEKADSPVIFPTLQLYRFAKAHNIAVFFLTGRIESERAATIKNLAAAGYKNWDGLILRPKEYEKSTAQVYKTAMRKQIENQGYDIILNIGDQKSDLLGGYADKTFKISNPYYVIQ